MTVVFTSGAGLIRAFFRGRFMGFCASNFVLGASALSSNRPDVKVEGFMKMGSSVN